MCGRFTQTASPEVIAQVNVGLTMLYWEIGSRILQNILKNKRTAYGEAIVSTLARQLEPEFGRGGFREIAPSHGALCRGFRGNRG
mgnify:CR=1 FL=1